MSSSPNRQQLECSVLIRNIIRKHISDLDIPQPRSDEGNEQGVGVMAQVLSDAAKVNLGSQQALAAAGASPARYNSRVFAAITATLDDAVERWHRLVSEAADAPARRLVFDAVCADNVAELNAALALGPAALSPALVVTLSHTISQLSRVSSPAALAPHVGQLIGTMISVAEEMTLEQGRPIRVAARTVLRGVGAKLFTPEYFNSNFVDWIEEQLKLVLSLEHGCDPVISTFGPAGNGETIVLFERLSGVQQENVRFAISMIDHMGHGVHQQNFIGADFTGLAKSIVAADGRVRAKSTKKLRLALVDAMITPQLEAFVGRFASLSGHHATKKAPAVMAGPSGAVNSNNPVPMTALADPTDASQAAATVAGGHRFTQADVEALIQRKEEEYSRERSQLLEAIVEEQRKYDALEKKRRSQEEALAGLTNMALDSDVMSVVTALLEREQKLKDEVETIAKNRQQDTQRLRDLTKKEAATAVAAEESARLLNGVQSA